MATLYPENTQYNAPSKFSKFPTLKKQVETKRVSSPIAGFSTKPRELTKEELAPIITPEANFPVGGQIVQPETQGAINLKDFLTKVSPSEPGGKYQFLNTPIEGNTQSNLWSAPSDSAVVQPYEGKGQYIYDPTQQGKIIRTQRNFSAKENELIRNGLNPAFYEIDHIVPLWGGGANTLENREILTKTEHAEKTKAQSVPLTLMANGLLSPEEAIKEAMDWKGKDTSNIESDLGRYNLNGLIPLELAKQKQEQWKTFKETGKTGNAWTDFMNTIKSIPSTIYKTGGRAYSSIFGTDESAQVPKEFIKGTLSAIPFADILVPELQKQPEDIGSGVSRFTGRLIGDLATFGLIRGLVTKTLGKIGVAKFAQEAKSTSDVLATGEKAGLLSPTLGVKKTALGYVVPNITNASIKRQMVNEALKSGLIMAAIGQTHAMPEDESRVKRIAIDTLYGSLLGTQGHTLRGYSNVGAITAMIGLMEGQPVADAVTNSITMMAMHGLGHGSASSIKKLAMEDPEYAAYITSKKIPEKTSLAKGALKNIGKSAYSSEIDARMISAAQNTIVKRLQARAEYESMSFRRQYLGEQYKAPEGTPEQISNQIMNENALIHDNFYKQKSLRGEEITPNEDKQMRLQTYLSGRELYKSSLPKEIRTQEDINDILSLGKKVVENNGSNVLGQPKDVETVARALPEEFYSAPKLDEFNTKSSGSNIGAEVQLGGSGGYTKEGENIATKQVLDDFVKLAESNEIPTTTWRDERGVTHYGFRGILVDETEAEQFMRGVNKRMNAELVASGDEIPMKNPQNVGGVFIYAKTKDGGIIVERAPFVARKSRIENYNKGVGGIYHPGNPEINKDTVVDAMRKNGSKYMLVNIDYIPKSRNLSKQTGEPTSIAKIVLNDKAWGEDSQIVKQILSTPRENIIPQEVLKEQSSKVSEVIQKTPEKAVEETLFPEKKIEVPKEIMEAKPKVVAEEVVKKPKEETITKEISSAREDVINNPSINDKKVFPIADETTTNSQAEEKIPYRAFMEWNNEKINKGAVKIIDREIDRLTLGSETKDPEKIKALVNLKSEFSKDKMIENANKAMSAADGDSYEGSLLFKDEIANRFLSLGLENPLENKATDAAFTRVFRESVFSAPRNVLRIKNNTFSVEKGDRWDFSPVDDNISKYKREVDPSSTIDTIYVENPSKRKKTKTMTIEDGSTESEYLIGLDVDSIYGELIKNGYVPMGASGNKINTIWGVKFDPKLADGKNINEEGALNIFTKNFFKKIMNFSENMTQDSLIKRAKIFNNHDIVNPIEGKIYNNYILKSPKLGDPELELMANTKFSANSSPSAIKNVTEKSFFDGGIYITKEHADEIYRKGGFVGERYRYKPTMMTPDGKVIQKGNITVMDKTTRDVFENKLGKKLGKYDIVTFEDNIKVGLESAQDFGTYKFIQTPSESWRFKYLHPHESSATLSLGNAFAKFRGEDGINNDIINLYKPEVEKFKLFVNELNSAKGSKEIGNVLEKYKEYGKSETFENLYGTMKKQVANGAGKISIGKNIDPIINKVFQEYVAAGGFIKGDHLVLAMDFGVKNGKHLAPDEVMISKATLNSLYGNGAYDELKNGKEFFILTVRYPITRKTAMSKAKVIIAEDYNIHNLGKEQMIPSHYDVYVRKEGDYDADAFSVFKIGGKDGVPESMVNNIEATRAIEGDMVMDPLNPFKKTKIYEGDLHEGIKSITKQAVLGGKSIGITGAINRIVPNAVDANLKIIMNPKKGSKRTVDAYFGNEKFYTFEILSKTKDGSERKTIEITPHYTSDDAKLVSQVSQESTDSLKSSNLAERLADYNDDASLYLVKNLFNNSESSDSISAISKVVKDKLQTPFFLSQSDKKIPNNISLSDGINNYNKVVSAMEKGGKVGPVQEIMKLFDGFKPFEYGEKDRILQGESEKLGVEAVKKTFPPKYKKSKNVELFEKFVNEKRRDYQATTKDESELRKEIKKGVIETYYSEFEPKLAPEEKELIHYFLITDPRANLATKDQYLGKYGFTNKFDEIFNDSPDMARKYYEARESYTPQGENVQKPQENIPKKIEQVGPKITVRKYTDIQNSVAKSSPQTAIRKIVVNANKKQQ